MTCVAADVDAPDFGHHNYDIKAKLVPGAKKGKYHTEFQSTKDMKTE